MKKTQQESSAASKRTSRGKVLSVVLLTIFLNLFLFHRNGSVALVLILGAYYIFGVVTFSEKGFFERNKILHLGLIATNMLFGLSILFVDNPFARTVVVLSWILTSSYSIYLFLENKPFFTDLEEMILAPVNMMLSYVISGFSILGKILTGNISEIIDWEQKPNLPLNLLFRVLIGGAISVPILTILIGLLSSGDPVFSYKVTRVFQEIGKIFDLKFWFQPIGHVIFSIIILTIFFPLALLKLRKVPLKYFPTNLPLGTEIAVLLGLVSLVLGSFLIVDFPYVFANVAETALSKFGVSTFSEYVKKGFFEFSLVSVIVYGLLWVGLGAIRGVNTSTVKEQRIGQRIRGVLIFLQTILFVEFGIFLVSIFRRIFLYQQFHGWSLARIYGGIFLIWVLGMLIVLVVRHFSKKSLLLAEVCITLLMVVFVGLFNAENFVVSTHPPTVNKRVDYVYLSRMSADGFEGWKKAYEYATQVLEVKNWESTKIENLVEGEGSGGSTIKYVGKDGRREIAYSGLIVNNLLGNYHTLIGDHATKDELENYLRNVLNLYELSSHDYENQIDLKIKNYEIQNNVQDAQYWKQTKQDVIEQRNKLIKEKELIGKSGDLNRMVYNDIGFAIYWTPNEFGGDPYHKSFYYFTPTSPEKNEHKSLDAIDYFVNWNFSRERAFQMMNKKIGFDNLLKLQGKYFDYYVKISSQPSSERGFDMDISTLSPLLGD